MGILRDFVKKAIRGVRRWAEYLDGELEWIYWIADRAPETSSLWELLKIWWVGIMPQNQMLYRFGQDNREGWTQYVSDRAWKARTTYLNGAYRLLLNDKLVMHRLLTNHGDYLPELFGVVEGSAFTPEPSCKADTLIELLRHRRHADPGGGVVIKPSRGSEGRDVRIVRFHQDAFCSVDGRSCSEREVHERLWDGAGSDPQIVTALVRNAEYARTLYPHTSNTIRILMMRDAKTGEPFVAAAVHRIGVEKSRPVDNFSAGGLAAEVDADSGVLSAACAKPVNGRIQRFSSHPGTEATIEGIEVPGWSSMKDGLKDILRNIPGIKYVGWDIVMKKKGFKILEGNSRPGMRILQVKKPLLDYQRVRNFYEKNNVL
jgi:hypothetical protein